MYEKVLKARPNEAKVREHLDDLKQGWALKGKQHAAARKFVYETWPKLDVAGLKQNLPEARKAPATLKEAGDRLTAEKMKQANAVHVANLAKETDRLKRHYSVDNANRAKAIAAVAAGLGRLHGEIAAFIAARP